MSNDEESPYKEWLSANPEDMTEEEMDKMIHEMFEIFMGNNPINGKSLPKGVSQEDFLAYIEECVTGDLPCTYTYDGPCKKPWYQCSHDFKYGPITPKKKEILLMLEDDAIFAVDVAYLAELEAKMEEDDEIMFDPLHASLSDEQIDFIDLLGKGGPNDESFLDPDWIHCSHDNCESCTQHALHHGIQHPVHNSKGETASIWLQCILKHGDTDVLGHQINQQDLMAYKPKNPDNYPLPPNPVQTQPKPTTKEKKKMQTMIKAKGRAKKIMKVVERFDLTWRDKGSEGFFNTIRCSPIYLRQFLEVLLNNLLKKEAIKIFRLEMDRLDNSLGEISSRTTIEEMVEDYYAGLGFEQKAHSLDVISDLMAQLLNDVIDSHLASGSNMGDVHRRMTMNNTSFAAQDPREQLDYYLNRGNTGALDSIFLKAYLTYDNDEGSTLPLSQKARGIHAIGTNESGLYMFEKIPSLHISLDAANNSTNRELIMSIARAWMFHKAESTLAKGLYIRTCPATPRPGALPNVRAATPRQFIDGVRMLGQFMTDPNHIDYDPQGCLIVQKRISAICSAVVVKGSNTLTIGPSNDGVTAGGGSNITFTLNPQGIRKMEKDINNLSLEDGMEHHEIELVYDGSQVGRLKTLPWFKRLADCRHTGGEGRIKPTIVQMRGLHAAKADLAPPPMVNGELLHLRGLIAAGSVEQLESMDVGKGSLDECIELEQMCKNGTLPKGLVVYAPSGTNAAHVAGVAGEHGFPVIFGIKPQKNHTVWTEIKGWVTTAKGAEPEPYDPTPMLDYYKIGLRDGDRFWTYNLAPLSQFLHNFISGPVNDPRLEAYLAGVYTSWIIKAALAVSMAEFRHGIGSSRGNIKAQRAFSHILIQQAIAGESGVSNLFSRSEYYQRLNYNELGYDMIHEIAQFYSDSYDPDITAWRDGSFGGEKYYNSTYPAQDASRLILQMLQGKKVNLKTLLNSVNQLENAVHNTGFFFNKFLGDKNAFDIGTGGHTDFASACEHWLVTAPFYAMFYTNYVNEPHRVAKGHDKLIQHLNSAEQKGHRGEIEMRPNLGKFVAFASTIGTLKDDIESHSLQEHEHFYRDQLIGGFVMHKNGMCGFEECTVGECKQAGMLIKLGLSQEVVSNLLEQLNEYMNWPALSFAHVPDALDKVTDALTAQGSRAASATAFTAKEREVNAPEVVVEHIGNQYGFPVWSIQSNNSDTKWIYLDQLLCKWWEEISDTISELEDCSAVQQYEAWKDPTPWVGEDFMDEVIKLGHTLNTAGEHRIYSRYWNPNTPEYSTPMSIVKCMIVAHDGRYNYDTYSLLMKLHEAGKINEKKGEIE